MNQIIAQGIGFIALALALIVFQLNNRRSMLYLQASSQIIWSVHYGLLYAWTGLVMNILGTCRTLLFSQRLDKKWAQSEWWPVVFIMIFCGAAVFSWEGYISILPLIGMIFGTIAFWSKSPRMIRWFSFSTVIPWLIYNYIVMSYPAMLAELLIGSSILIGILRYDILHMFRYNGRND